MPKEKKTGGKSSRIYTVIMIIGLALIIFACVNLVRIMMNYHTSGKIYKDLNNQYVKVNDKDDTPQSEDTQTAEIPWYELASVDLSSIQQQNPEVAGWIFFENEKISYPVMYSGDDDKYLRTTWDGTSASAGSIFLEGGNARDFNDSHTIIYGHNMKDLSMFGRLKYYKKDGYYDDHQYFQIFTKDKIYRYQIFSYEDVEADSFIYTIPYGETDEFQNFINELYKLSYKDTGVTAASNNKIVTLSTCSSDDKRFVVHGVRVSEYANTSGNEDTQ